MRKTKRIGLAVAAAAAISGCTSLQTPMTDFATDYNRVIADTRNEMILLNIVRASEGEPTHYSALSSVSGNLSIGASASASLSGIIDDVDAGAGTSISVRSSPSFQIIPLNTRDFATGILRPVEPNVVALFLSQGWNQNLLAALMVESITCGSSTYNNDLRSDGDRSGRRQYLSTDQAFGLGFAAEDGGGSNGPILSLDAEQADSLGMILENLGDDYRVTIRRAEDGTAIFDVFERSEQTLNITLDDTARPAECNDEALTPDNYELRSVEGIIYYLGEILRSGDGRLISSNGDVVFALSNSAPARGHSIRVSHNGQTYFVPHTDAAQRPRDRTIQVISLINQLIGLQTASEALERSPGTLTIN
jgi:antitoxin (DNA-binding transcriptional repressor) of toxin-antitoxin stability system